MSGGLAGVLRHLCTRFGSATDDAQLLERFARERDEQAFAELVRRHGGLVLGVARRHLGDRHRAEDVFQDTFLALARQARRLGPAPSLVNWLYTVALHLSRRTRAAADRRDRRLACRPPAGPPPDPLAEVSGRELMGILDAELARLPEAYRLPLLLCAVEGLSREEAARRLGWPAGSVKGRLERGRELLRARLARRGLTVPAVLAAGLVNDPAGAVSAELVRTVTRAALAVPVAAGSLNVVAVVLVVTALGVGVGVATLPGRHPAAPAALPPPAAAAQEAARVDRLGDPLPDGTVLRLGTTRLRHPRVFTVAFTADGKLVSFGGDYTARVWDPATGRQISERSFEKSPFHHHTWGAGLSADARRLAVQLGDRLKVFEVESGRELASVALASTSEAAAQFSPDGRQLAVVDEDGKGLGCRVQVCDIDRNVCGELARAGRFSSAPAFSRDGRRLALATSFTTVVVWDLPTGRELARFKPPGPSGARTVDFDATGDVLAVLGWTNPPQSFHFVQISTGQPPDGWTAPPVGDVIWARFTPEGTALLLGSWSRGVSWSGGVRWFDPKAGKTTRTADGLAQLPPAFSPDGRFVASARPNKLEIWDAQTGQSAVPAGLGDSSAGEVHGAAVSPDGQWILTKDADTGTIRVWDSGGQPKGVIRSNRWGGRYPAFSPDGRHLFGMAPDAIALVRWDFPGGAESARYTFAEPAADHVYVYNFALSADGRRLAAITQTINRNRPGGRRPNESTTLTIWDTATAKRVESREVDSRAFDMYGAFSPDLAWYFFGDRPGALAGGRDFRLELPQEWHVRQAAASPDCRLVAQVAEQWITDEKGNNIGVESRGVVVHEAATGKQVLVLPTERCGPIAFTPDGRGLVTTDAAAIIRWDLATRKPVMRPNSPGPFVGSYGNSFASSLALSADGARAITGHIDTTALVWDLPPPPRRAGTLSGRALAAAWDDLAGGDAGKAYAAVWALADAAGDAVPFLRDRLRPTAVPPEDRVRKLVAGLDARAFADREAAEKELSELGAAAVPVLRTLLKGGLSAEQAQRVERLLTAADAPVLAPGDRLRQVRAVAALELAGTVEARRLLAELAGGAAEDRQTQEAKAALDRLARTPKPVP